MTGTCITNCQERGYTENLVGRLSFTRVSNIGAVHIDVIMCVRLRYRAYKKHLVGGGPNDFLKPMFCCGLFQTFLEGHLLIRLSNV